MAHVPSKTEQMLDSLAFMAATEAVVGLMAQKKTLNTENVRAWLERSLDGNTQLIARATMYANRMISGPFSADWPRAVA